MVFLFNMRGWYTLILHITTGINLDNVKVFPNPYIVHCSQVSSASRSVSLSRANS